MIRGKTISYASHKKKTRENIESDLNASIKELYDLPLTDDIKIKIQEKEDQLKAIREEKVKGIILRAKARWKVEGEKSTRYFCNLEKRHYTEKKYGKINYRYGSRKNRNKGYPSRTKAFL